MGVLSAWLIANLEGWQNNLRSWATTSHIKASTCLDDRQVFWLHLQGWAFTLAAGALPGLISGYLSHLAADAQTTRSLPLVANKADWNLIIGS